MKRSIGILLYLVLMAVFLKFDLRLLFDVRQLLLVVFGTFLLLLPSLYEQGSKKEKGQGTQESGRRKRLSSIKGFLWEERATIGQNAVWAGVLQSFVLLVINMNTAGQETGSMQAAALSCRPILYGFCIWVILQEPEREEKHSGSEKQGNNGSDGKMTVEPSALVVDYRKCLQDLGLTKREVEIALLVIQKETNAEIADRLFISETTVKKHLSNIFSKLVISQRQEIKERCVSISKERLKEDGK